MTFHRIRRKKKLITPRLCWQNSKRNSWRCCPKSSYTLETFILEQHAKCTVNSTITEHNTIITCFSSSLLLLTSKLNTFSKWCLTNNFSPIKL